MIAQIVKQHHKIKILDKVILILLIFFGVLLLYPVLYGLFGSLSSQEEFMNSTLLVFSKNPFKNFVNNYFLIFKDNTLGLSLVVTFGKIIWGLMITVFTSVLAGYVFAKLKFPFKRVFFILFISSMMIPGPAMIIPNYIWMSRFPLMGGNNILGEGGSGFLDNPLMLVLTGWINVYNIFLCRQSFATLGNDMSEAAKIDGASFFRIVFTIYFPLIKPIVAVMFLNLFLGIWNDYLGNLVNMSNSPHLWTIGNVVVRGMQIFIDPNNVAQNYPAAFGIAFISMVPPIIVYCFVQKQFTEGLAMGAVKE